MKGNTLTTVLIIIGLIAVGAWVFLGRNSINLPSSAISTSTPTSAATAKINGNTISLIVADTDAERELGLGGRQSLGENEAMLFVFETTDIYEFWMKDMLIPIDIIWLDEGFKVVHIQSHVAPETYPDETFANTEKARYVLETNAGFVDKNNLKIGDVVEVGLNK